MSDIIVNKLSSQTNTNNFKKFNLTDANCKTKSIVSGLIQKNAQEYIVNKFENNNKTDSEKIYRASWKITEKCNYLCSYCYSTKDRKIIENKINPDSIIRTLTNTDKIWNVCITGGEPFIVDNFIELCEKITQNNFVSIDTNLSLTDKITEFANKINPLRVKYIYASLHIIERKKRNEIKQFIINALLLKNKGFKININYVMYPPIFNKFELVYKVFKKYGLNIEPKPFKGIYNNKSYPESYSIDEINLISKYSQNKPYKKYTPQNYKNKLCSAGYNFIRIDTNGNIRKCLMNNESIGNINSKIILLKKPEKCEFEYCTCFGGELTNE